MVVSIVGLYWPEEWKALGVQHPFAGSSRQFAGPLKRSVQAGRSRVHRPEGLRKPAESAKNHAGKHRECEPETPSAHPANRIPVGTPVGTPADVADTVDTAERAERFALPGLAVAWIGPTAPFGAFVA